MCVSCTREVYTKEFTNLGVDDYQSNDEDEHITDLSNYNKVVHGSKRAYVNRMPLLYLKL